jgi:hypothetical protein
MDNNRRRPQRPGLFAQSFQVLPSQRRRQPHHRRSRVIEAFDSGSERDRHEHRGGFPPRFEDVKELIGLYIAQGRGRGAYVVAKKREWEENDLRGRPGRQSSFYDRRGRHGRHDRDYSSSSSDDEGGAPGKPMPRAPVPSGPPPPPPPVQFSGPAVPPVRASSTFLSSAPRMPRSSQLSVLRREESPERESWRFEEDQVRERPQVHIPDYARMAPGQAPSRIVDARHYNDDVSRRGGAVPVIDPGESKQPKRLLLVFLESKQCKRTDS